MPKAIGWGVLHLERLFTSFGGSRLGFLKTYPPVFDEIAEDGCHNVQAVENGIS